MSDANAREQGRGATKQGARARDEAKRAESDGQAAENNAEQHAARAEQSTNETVDAAVIAAEKAHRAGLIADELLLDENAQELAAQASDEQPFGIPGKPVARHNWVRVGFTVTFGGLLAIALGATIVALEQEFVIIVIAAFIAIGLEPGVSWLTRRHLPRWTAVLVVSLVSVGLVAAFLAAAIPPLVKEASQLVKHGPQYLQQLQDKHTFIGHLNNEFHLEDKLKTAASQNLSISSVGGLLSVGEAIISFTVETIIVLVLVLYILADFDGIKRGFYRMVPLGRRPRVALLTDEILSRTGGYILGNLLTSLIAIICQYVILRALGVPYALVLSVFVGILDLVPLVGSTVAGILVTLVALATVSVAAAIINVVFTVVYRLAEDYFINPRILKRTVDVSALVTVVAVILGGALLGIVGALLAVPAAAAVQLIITEVIYPRMDRFTAEN